MSHSRVCRMHMKDAEVVENVTTLIGELAEHGLWLLRLCNVD